MLTKDECTEIVNFMTPGAGVLVLGHGNTVKCNILSPLLVSTGAWIRQTEFKLMITEEGSTKIVNFMPVLMLGHGFINHCEYASSFILSIYSTLIAIVLRDYTCNAAFLTIVDFFLFILRWDCWYANICPSDKKSV